MRNLIRLLSALALLGGTLLVTALPATADHNGTKGGATTIADPDGGYHELPPHIAVAGFEQVCAVAGGVAPGTSGTHGIHALTPLNDASHSHYNFKDAAINCQALTAGGTVITNSIVTTSDGGNDGHYVDILDSGNTQIPVIGGGTDHDLVDGGPLPDHEDHHGSTNESAWSNSSLYSHDPGTNAAKNLGESNVCRASGAADLTANLNRNKADITATFNGTSTGWLKYIRVGTGLYVWGCFFTGGPVGGQVFSAALTVFPPQVVPNPPTVPPFPECLIPGAAQSCGFTIAGFAHLSDDWLLPSVP